MRDASLETFDVLKPTPLKWWKKYSDAFNSETVLKMRKQVA